MILPTLVGTGIGICQPLLQKPPGACFQTATLEAR